MFGVPAFAVEHRNAAVSVFVDACGNLFPFLGDDDELFGLSVGVDELVGHVRDDERAHPAVDNHWNTGFNARCESAVVWQKQTRSHNGHIGYHHGAANGDVADLVDHGCHDVSAARRAVVDEYRPHTDAAENGA